MEARQRFYKQEVIQAIKEAADKRIRAYANSNKMIYLDNFVDGMAVTSEYVYISTTEAISRINKSIDTILYNCRNVLSKAEFDMELDKVLEWLRQTLGDINGFGFMSLADYMDRFFTLDNVRNK